MLRPLSLLLALCAPAAAQDWSGHGLSLSLEALGELESKAPDPEIDYLAGFWHGQLEGASLKLELFVIPRAAHGLNEPSDLVDLTEVSLANRDRRAKRPLFAFDESKPLTGAYGFISYGWLGLDVKRQDTKPVGHFWCLGGILEQHGYTVEITSSPALNEAGVAAVERFLKEGVRYDGEVADTKWSDDEIEARWQRQAPDKVLEDSKLRVVRSKHYVILTNVGKGTSKSFGKKIDEAYEKIREIYPFEDIEGQRLLPIFYFNTPDQYFEWCVKNLKWKIEKARRSGGVSSGDVYSTYHQATNAPVHIHEATHQIFKNRLRLGGGGSWFQEGVAEYMSAAANELGIVKNLTKEKKAKRGETEKETRDKNFSLEKFFALQSMLFSIDPEERKKSGSVASENYTVAAGVIEFVRHGKYKDRFLDFVHAIGRVPRSDLPAIEKQLQLLFDRDIQGFDEDFMEYWTKRKKPRKK